MTFSHSVDQNNSNDNRIICNDPRGALFVCVWMLKRKITLIGFEYQSNLVLNTLVNWILLGTGCTLAIVYVIAFISHAETIKVKCRLWQRLCDWMVFWWTLPFVKNLLRAQCSDERTCSDRANWVIVIKAVACHCFPVKGVLREDQCILGLGSDWGSSVSGRCGNDALT